MNTDNNNKYRGRAGVRLATWAILALGGVGVAAATTVQVTNLVDGTTLRYPLALVSGVYDGQSLQIATTPTNAAVSFTTYNNQFRCLVDLQPGTNMLTLTDNHGPVNFHLVFVRSTSTNWHHKVWYVVPADEAATPADPNWYVHFGLQTKLMQSWMAEDQLRAGNGRVTFYPEMDASNNVNVGLLVLSQTRAQVASGAGYGLVSSQIPAPYNNGTYKNVAFTTVDFEALGGGNLGYVGAYQNIFPDRASDIMSKLLSTTSYGSDSLTFADYCGVTLHEMSHCLNSIWHDFGPYNIMGGYYDISEYFTLTYSDANPTPHYESSAGTLGAERDLARWDRSLMNPDPYPYINATVGITIGSEYIVSTSPNPLAIFQYYIPSSDIDLHTNLYASDITTFSKHLGQAYGELGSAPFNVMTVDTQGNMSYTTFSSGRVPVYPLGDTYNFAPNSTNTIAAAGVLNNDVNPSGSTLSALLATNVLHGTLAFNTNGGFTYTPTAGFIGIDTFWYRASDGISSDLQAMVTLLVGTNGVPPSLPLVNVGGNYDSPNSAIGSGNAANLTNNTTFGWEMNDCAIPALLNGFTFTIDSGGGNPMNYKGVISGNGTVTFNSSASAAIRVGGSTANTYSGNTLVNYGWVNLEKPNGQDALLGNITVGGSSTGWLTWSNSNQINDAANVTLAKSSHLDLAGFSDSFNSLTMPAGTYVATGLGTNNFLRVNSLTLGGIMYTTGAFGASTPGGYVTGSGYILVGGTPPPVVTQPPDMPSSPSPSDGATGVQPLYPVLSWANSLGATAYDLYLWLAANSQPTTPTASGLAVVQYTPANILSNLTAYKWQVVAKNSAGSTTGAVWTFTTRSRTDISNVLTPWEPANPALGVNIDYQVGTGNTGRLVGLTQTHWASGGFTVDLNLNTNLLIIDSGGGNAMSANSAITGTGSLRFNSVMGVSMHVGGTRANTYSGPTLINSGWVNLEKPKGTNALLGTITVGGSSQAKLVWANHNQIDSTADVIVANTSYLSLAGFTNTIHSLTLASGTYVDTGTGGVLTVASLKVGTQSYGGGTYTSSGYSFVTGSGSIVVVPAPFAPVGLTAAATNLQVSLSWNVVTNATGYNVRRSLANTGFSTVLGRASGPSVTNYVDTQVTNGVLYWYVVSATNSMGESTNSLAVSARPLPAAAPTPVLLTGTGTNSGFSLSPATGSTLRFSGMGGINYCISYSDDLLPGSWTNLNWQLCTNNGTGMMALVDPGATNRPQRFYRVGAQKP